MWSGVFATILAVSSKHTYTAGECQLGGSWGYLSPSAFNHTVNDRGDVDGWHNQACHYSFVQTGSLLKFRSPTGCLDDGWHRTATTGSVLSGPTNSSGGHVHLSYTQDIDGSVVAKKGSIAATCDFIDMDDGGLYFRGINPIDMDDHAWLKTAAAWIMRAGLIRFPDGSVHLTPGYPTHYDGQWMRDGFYGIAGAWDVTNTTHHSQFEASLLWMLSRARPDGVLPQMCKFFSFVAWAAHRQSG